MSNLSPFIALADAVSVLLLMSLMEPCYIKHSAVKAKRANRRIFFVRHGIDKYMFCGNCLITFRMALCFYRILERHHYQEGKQEFL